MYQPEWQNNGTRQPSKHSSARPWSDLSLALGLCGIVAIFGFGQAAVLLKPNVVEAQPVPPSPIVQYEYIIVVPDEHGAVAHTEASQLEIRRPADDLSGEMSAVTVTDSRYTHRGMAVRHAGVGALNVLGLSGWEAYATTVDQQGTVTIHMKRPRVKR